MDIGQMAYLSVVFGHVQFIEICRGRTKNNEEKTPSTCSGSSVCMRVQCAAWSCGRFYVLR